MKRFTFVLAFALLSTVALLTTAGAKQVNVTLNPVGDSGESGTATIARDADGNLVVTINITGEPAGSNQPAHIHAGTCDKIDPVPKVMLTNVVDGKSVTTVPAPAQAPTGARSIVVHKGTGPSMGTYVACGEIPAP